MRTQFARFVLDDGRRQLLEADRRVHLSPKAYELLKLLVAHRPNAVSKSQIHEHLWPGIFVSDVNLAALVAELRSALGQRGKRGAQFIRTIYGFGYAFDAQATDLDGEPGAGAAKPAAFLIVDARTFRLAPGANVVGRAVTADVRLDDSSVSREHARIIVSEKDAALTDLNSKNGTWVREEKVEGIVRVEDGDEIRFGTAVATFRISESAAETRTADPGEEI